MRIAIFTSHFPGRVNTFFARDVRGLLDAGVDVEIFDVRPLEPVHWPQVPEVLSERVLPRTKVHHIGTRASVRRAMGGAALWQTAGSMAAILASAVRFGPVPMLKSVYVMPKALAWAREHAERFDHVLAYWGNYAATCAYLFHRAAGRAIPFSTFLHAGTDLYRSRVYLEEKLTYADNIIVVCDFNRRFLQQVYPDAFDRWAPKIYLHHLGLDLDSLPFTAGGREPNRVLAVGGLHKTKGFDDLMRAAADLGRAGRTIRLRIVGDGPEGPALRQLAERLRVSVDFLGWRTFDVVRDEMQRAAVLVHPSKGLGDAVPTVVKEAMALGTPVVASAVAGIPELLDDGRCGVLVAPQDPEALAAAIGDLLHDSSTRAVLATRARARAVELFDLTRNGRALAARLAPPQHTRSSRALLEAAAVS